MLNKKGFTIAEVLVSFSLISMILFSIISSTVFYRDKLKEEEVKSQLVDFKNTITKVIYDDILAERAVSVDRCIGISNCVQLIGKDGSVHLLRIEEVLNSTSNTVRGSYLNYDGVRYMLPDSDLSEIDRNGAVVRVCDFINGISFVYDDTLYTIKISFEHKDYNLKYDILLTMG